MHSTTTRIGPDLLRANNHHLSAWIAIRGVVYDVTEFVRYHPGGQQVMLMAAGRDATIVFETYHEMERVQHVLAKLPVVGQLHDPNPQLPAAPPISAFHSRLRENAARYFRETFQNPKNPVPSAWDDRYKKIFLSVFVLWLAQFGFFVLYPGIQIACAVLMGVACALVGLHPMHDGSHCSVTRDPSEWLWLSASHDFINGASSTVWFYQHVLGHHPYTNVADADPDITVSMASSSSSLASGHQAPHDFRRILPQQPWHRGYRLQYVFVPILYAFLAWKTRAQDFVIMYITKRNGNIPVNPMTTTQACIFWLGKLFFLTYRVVMPSFMPYNSLSRVLLLLMVSDIVTSYWLALAFQANHVVTHVKLPVKFQKQSNSVIADDPKRGESSEELLLADMQSEAKSQQKDQDQDQDQNKGHSCWAVAQIETTLDYAVDDPVVTFLVGSLNLQAVHHIFPGIHQSYYPALVPILRQTCLEFGVEYCCLPTFRQALASHIGLLKKLGCCCENAE